MRAAELNEQQERWIQTVPQKSYYTVQECSIILDVGPPSVYSAIKRGSMKGVRINGVTHVKHEELIKYINRRGTGRKSTDMREAVIEEINPDEDAARSAVQMVQDVEDELEEGEDVGRSSPLDFLSEE